MKHWLDKKKLALNLKKIKVSVAKKGGRNDKFEIRKWREETIKRVDSFQNLGYNGEKTKEQENIYKR